MHCKARMMIIFEENGDFLINMKMGDILKKCKTDLNLNSLLVTRQMTLFHQVVMMGEKLVPRTQG